MNSRLNIQDLADLLAERCRRTPEEAERFLRLLVELITEGVFQDQQVKVKGLGTFKLIGIEPRESVDVNTGERILIKAHYKFSFLPDKELREEVNKPFSAFETTEIVRPDAFKDMIEEMASTASGSIDAEEAEASEEEILPEVVVLPPAEESVQTESEEFAAESVRPTSDETELAKSVELPLSSEAEPVGEQHHVEFRGPIGPPVAAPAKHKVWHFVAMELILVAVAVGAYYIGKTQAFRQLQEPERPSLASIAEQDSLFELSSDSIEMAAEAAPVDTLPMTSAPLAKVTIQKGDRLTSYANRYYGHKLFWVYIYQHNRQLITDPNNVPIGTELEIPAPELYDIDAKSRHSLEAAAALQTEILTTQM